MRPMILLSSLGIDCDNEYFLGITFLIKVKCLQLEFRTLGVYSQNYTIRIASVFPDGNKMGSSFLHKAFHKTRCNHRCEQ